MFFLRSSLIVIVIFILYTKKVYADESTQYPLITWLDVEIIADDAGDSQHIRDLTGIMPGTTLALNDPKLAAACNNVRKVYKNQFIICHAIESENSTAYYVVELSTIRVAPSTMCHSEVSIDPVLLNKSEEFAQIIVDQLRKNQSPLENFVNKSDYLDYANETLHKLANELNSLLSNRLDELVSNIESCDSTIRATAVNLLNFTGKPVEAINAAQKLILDPDVTVRNNAIRLISVFHNYINQNDVQRLAADSCSVMKNTSFFDRNKSLALLFQLVKNNDLKKNDLSEKCLTQISYNAKNSRTPQIGEYARNIIKILNKNDED